MTAPAPAEPPLFSIVVPTFERPRHVAELLAAWARVDFPRDRFELIVADDGGTADLGSLVGAAGGLPVRLLTLPHRSASAARAAGLAAARGDFILCTDDDCLPDPGILRGYEAAIARHPGAALGGPVDNVLVDDVFATATQDIITYVCAAWNRDPAAARFFTFSNVVFPAARFRAAGGFDPDWRWRTGEDRDVCRRWCEEGGRMVVVPDARMGHAHGLSLRRFLRQHFHYGQGNHATTRRRSVAGAGPPDWSGPGFYAGLFLYPFRVHPPGRAAVVAGLVGLAQVATLAGSIDARLRWRAMTEGGGGRA